MKTYSVFLKKELFESVKTYKIFIIGAVFLLFGMASPLLAKLTPEIIKWAMESDPAMTGVDFSGLITQPVAFDSWMQFYGNAGQLGYIVLVIMFSSMLSSELSRGTLRIMFSKGLTRPTVIFSKLTSASLIWTGSFCLSALTAWVYTIYMFDEAVSHLFLAMLCMWVFGIFLLALTMLMAVLTNKGYACMVSVGLIAIVCSLLEMIPQIKKYNPMQLYTSSRMLLIEESTPKDFIPVLIVTGVLIVGFVWLAVVLFNKKRNI